MQPLIVLGMHRSGTSLAASLLESAGLHVGERLLGANASNPRGHFEDEDFVEFEQAVLRELGLSPDGWVTTTPTAVPATLAAHAQELIERKQRAGRPWGWKDPRTVPLLPLWRPLLPEARFAVVYRAPWEVVESLLRRGDAAFAADPELAVQVWRHYNQLLLDLVLASPERCVLSNVDALAADPAAWVAAVAVRTGTPLQTPRAAIVEPTLLHGERARERAGVLFRHYPDVVDLYARLERLAYRPDAAGAPLAWTSGADAAAERRSAMRDWAAASGAEGAEGRSADGRRSSTAPSHGTPGWCACCRGETTFLETGTWLRDQFLCERCRSIPRFRAVNHTLDMHFPGWDQAAIHEFLPRNDFMSRHCARYSSSPLVEGPLPFADATFDLVVTQDVLEHVFEPEVVLREITRIVKPGGAHVFTAPKHKGLRATRQRARLDGAEVRHLLPAEYHGDPLAADRELVTWDYGDDFEGLAGRWCGLPTVTYVVRDRALGLDGEYLDVFVIRKPGQPPE